MTELMRQEINLQNCRGEMDVNIHLKLDTIIKGKVKATSVIS